MESKKYFKTFYARLKREGWLKSLIAALVLGFAVVFCAALAVWLIRGLTQLWLPAVCGAAAALVSAPLFYRFRFRPTAKSVARRVDALGLEERMITMIELENDDSYIAMRQREDALEKIREADAKSIKFSVSRVSLALLAAFAVLGMSMSAVTLLSASGKIKDGSDIIDDIIPEEPIRYITVSYVVTGDLGDGIGGIIEGEADQIIPVGTDAAPVIAVADDGWMFVCWQEDESEDPARSDTAIAEDVVYTAVFQRVGESSEGDGDGEPGDGDGDGDGEPSDQPGDPSDSNNNSNSSDSSFPSDGEGSGASGRYDPANQIKNGDEYYRDSLQQYYGQAMDLISQGKELPPALRDIIERYYGTIS